MQADRSAPIKRPLASTLVVPLFLCGHVVAILWIAPASRALSFAFLIAAPLLAAVACALASRRGRARGKWRALALGLLLWAGGMAASMFQEVVRANLDATPALGMLLFVLYGVPLTYALASHDHDIPAARAIDGVLALVLGALFAVHTFSFASWSGADQSGYDRLRLMFDIENAFLLVFALLRWHVAEDRDGWRFFRALSLYVLLYAGVAFYINHVDRSQYGALADVAITVPFLLLFTLAVRPGEPGPLSRPQGQVARFIRVASPLVLPIALLIVSTLVARRSLGLAIAGFVVATLGYGLRSVLLQLHAAREHDRLDALARVDALTGLANRRQFDDILGAEWSRARRGGGGIALLLLDLDHFKQLNDTLGHPAGDAALRQVAQALVGCVHRGGDVVARYGGEEFAVVLPGMSAADAVRMAERMRRAVAGLEIASPSPSGRVTTSVGVAAIARAEAGEPSSLVQAADAALYAAKRRGRDQVAHDVEPFARAPSPDPLPSEAGA